MPLYDYECKECGHCFEELIFDNDEKVPCQKCQSSNTAQCVPAPSPLKTNPFPYKIGKTLPKAMLGSQINRTCPKAGACGASTQLGGLGDLG